MGRTGEREGSMHKLWEGICKSDVYSYLREVCKTYVLRHSRSSVFNTPGREEGHGATRRRTKARSCTPGRGGALQEEETRDRDTERRTWDTGRGEG